MGNSAGNSKSLEKKKVCLECKYIFFKYLFTNRTWSLICVMAYSDIQAWAALVLCTPLKQVAIIIKGFIMASKWYYSEQSNYLHTFTADPVFTLASDKAADDNSFSTVCIELRRRSDSTTVDNFRFLSTYLRTIGLIDSPAKFYSTHGLKFFPSSIHILSSFL